MKKEEDYKGAIERFKYVISSGKTKKYISESIYEVALLNQKTGNNEDAIKYYNKYINTYTSRDQYYDDAFYQLGMLYYNTGELKQAQKTFYGLRSEVPDSMYNNSKVDEILKER
ncbi:Tetratricopeptide repeat protein [Romboutsia lituseburensis]|nr:tetratricopeptide repeat protein [Romboutsia lituseburensis]CEH35163.1 Tetratricopeptide repeat protein [Romboutsia lituseburensis]